MLAICADGFWHKLYSSKVVHWRRRHGADAFRLPRTRCYGRTPRALSSAYQRAVSTIKSSRLLRGHPTNGAVPRNDLSNAHGGNRTDTTDRKQYGRKDSYIKRPAGGSRRPSVLLLNFTFLHLQAKSLKKAR